MGKGKGESERVGVIEVEVEVEVEIEIEVEVEVEVCKRCGRRKVSDGEAKGKHGCRVKKTSKAYCKVAEEMYLPGYPKAGYFIEE